MRANPPSRVLLTCVLGILTAIGWVYGRIWFTVAHLAAFCGLVPVALAPERCAVSYCRALTLMQRR